MDPALKSAWEKAARSGQPVEIPARFTETMKVWADPDGKHLRAELHTRPIQLKNASGQTWEPIDPTIVTRDGKIQATRVKTPLTFGGRGAKRLISADGKQGTTGLSVTRDLPEPKISGNTVTYPNAVAAGADLVVRAQADGFISQVVFQRKPEGPVTVRLPLTLPKGTTFGTTSRGLPQLKDDKGEARAAPVVLTATDAKVESSPDEGRTSPVQARVETSGARPELVFSPDEKFLADPAVTYPVTIAASSEYFGGGVPDDAFVSRNDPYNNHAAEGWLRAGTTSTSADIARVYLKFNTDDPELEGAKVVDADLRMWNYKSGGPGGQLCGDPMGAGIVAARVTSAWTLDGTADSLDWYNQPSSTGVEGLNRAGYNYDAAAGTWCAKDDELFHRISTMARAWIEQDVPNHGLVLRAASESATINWRQYYSSQFGGGEQYPGYRHPPALIVEYTPAPLVETTFVTDRTLPDDFTRADVAAELADTAAPDVVDTTVERERAIARNTRISTLNGITEPMEYAPGGIDPAEPDPGTPTPSPSPTAPAATYVRADPVTAVDGTDVITSLTPKLLAQPFDPEERPSRIDFEVAHDPAHPTQGSGTIWSAQHDNVANGGQAQADVPAGTLTDGWYVRIRARATAGEVTGDWSEWRPYLIDTTPTTPTPTPTPTQAAGLVAAYGMDEGSGTTVADSSGQNNTGAGSATSWADGKYGKALSFDGSAGWVTVQDAASLRLTTGMTLSAWVNPASVSAWSPIVGKELSSDAVSYTLYASNGSAPSGWVQTDPDTHSTVNGASPLPVGTWSHVALTYDGAALRLFVNGQQVTQSAFSGSLHDDGSPLRIGGNAAWNEHFSGLIDEVRIYNRAQGQAEIQSDMNSPVGSGAPNPSPTPTVTPTPTPTTPTPVPGLVAAYGMEEGSGTTVGDSSGQNNVATATDTTWTTGRHGKALSFNGSSSWATVPHAASLRLTDAMTLSAWVRPAALSGVWRSVLMKENAAVGGVYGLYADSEYTAPSGWLQTVEEGGGLTGEDPLPLNQWSHLAVTYGGDMMILYVNGAEVARAPIAGEILDDGGPLRIGGNAFWGEFYSGLIDEVRVYNRVETAAQIQADMNTPIGPAATGPAPQALGTDLAHASGIDKLAVNGSTLTPRLTAWLSAGRDGETKVELELARKPGKSGKSGKLTKRAKTVADQRPIWSGQVTARSGDSQVSLQVPKGRLRAGEQLRWRARATGPGGTWTGWQPLTVQEKAAEKPEARTAAALGPYTPDPILTNGECTKYPASGYANESGEEDHQPYGYVKNRFTWCKWGWIWRSSGPSELWVTNRMRFRYTLIGQTFQGSRDIAVRLILDDFKNVKGRYYSDPATQLANRFRFGFNFGSACQSKFNPAAVDPVLGHSQSIADWRVNSEVWFWLTAPKPPADPVANPDFLSTCEISPWVQAENNDPRTVGVTRPWRQPLVGARDENGKPVAYGIRCDTARKMKNTSGCVFTRVTPWLQFAKSDAAAWVKKGQQYVWLLESWEHFDTAEKRPWLTIPRQDDKHFPGFRKAEPLHRIVDDTKIRANRAAAQAMCKWGWPPDERVGLGCDEYPFASTREGTTSGGPVSVDMITTSDNNGFGFYVLGPWYEKERIIYNDEFYLKIVEQAPPRDF